MPSMNSYLEVPHVEDFAEVAVTAVSGEEAGVVSVTAESDGGAVVSLTWDVIARSVTVRWSEGDLEVFNLYRESATKLTITDEAGWVVFRVWSAVDGLLGVLVVCIGEVVTVHDQVLFG